jgi:predicted adenylyl cyclase CyaB
MPKNLELKARLSSLGNALRIARKINARYEGILHQTDRYYRCRHGRLKIRTEKSGRAEMIFYKRPNKKGSRISDYIVLPLNNPELLDKFFADSCGKKIKVEKRRILYLYKNSRIHLDRVRGLGMFIEFEVLVKHGRKQARDLMSFLVRKFEIKNSSRISVSYSDLLTNVNR